MAVERFTSMLAVPNIDSGKDLQVKSRLTPELFFAAQPQQVTAEWFCLFKRNDQLRACANAKPKYILIVAQLRYMHNHTLM